MPSVSIIGTRGYPSFYGGFETAVRNLAPYLVDKGWDVAVYGRARDLSKTSADDRVRSVVTTGIETKSLSTLTYGLTSSGHAAFKRPDVGLVMNVANGYWLPLLKARRIPTVVNVDGLEWTREKWGKAARGVFLGGAKMTAKFADHLVFDARAIGDHWRTQFGRSGTWIPYGGTDSTGRPFDEAFPARKYVLAVARFVPENTVGEFLQAAEELVPDHDVVLVGSSGYGGTLDEKAKQLADRYEKFHWLGHIRDDERLFSLWKNAGAYFHGHSVGGTNPALVQAMMLGAPTVARDTIFNREVLGDGARYTSPSPNHIAAAIKAVLTDERERDRISALSRERAQAHYTWARVNGAYEQLLRDAISMGRKDQA